MILKGNKLIIELIKFKCWGYVYFVNFFDSSNDPSWWKCWPCVFCCKLQIDFAKRFIKFLCFLFLMRGKRTCFRNNRLSSFKLIHFEQFQALLDKQIKPVACWILKKSHAIWLCVVVNLVYHLLFCEYFEGKNTIENWATNWYLIENHS